MGKIRFLGLDLDGTLLNSEKKIGEKTLSGIKELDKGGVGLFIVSGRHFREVQKLISRLLSESRILGVVACDGLYAFNYNNELIYTGSFLNKDSINQLLTYHKAHSILCVCPDCQYLLYFSFFPYLIGLLKKIIKRSNSIVRLNKLKKKDKSKEIEKLIIKEKIKKEVLSSLMEKFTIHPLKEDRTELLARNVNKWNALYELGRFYNINFDELCYFGDDYNDLECFQHLKYCIAMEGSPQEIQDLSWMKTTDCDHEGIMNGIRILKAKGLLE